MIVEVVAVGTELLLGQIVNGNAAVIGSKLAEAGLDSYYHQVVGDNLHRIDASIRLALSRADAVIITGGIGPTQDDITREAICEATGRAMAHSDEYAGALQRRWEALGREFPSSNLRQADHPEGAIMLANPKGSAPGLMLEHQGSLIFAIPGVPEEMRHLLDAEVIPRLCDRAGLERVIVSRVLRTWGLAESKVGEMLEDLFAEAINPSIAFLAGGGEIKVRLTAAAADRAAAEALIIPLEDQVRARLGSVVFGADDDTIETVLQRLLEGRGWTIGTVESATAGLIASRLASLPGASRSFVGSLVTYSLDSKRELLGLDITDGEVVTEETAKAMALAGRARLGADVVVAVTGSAGPDPQEQPVGTMIVAVATPDTVRVRTLRLPGDRERVRQYATTAGLHNARLTITGDG